MTPLQIHNANIYFRGKQRQTKRYDPIEELIDELCFKLNISKLLIQSKCRGRDVVMARMIIAKELRDKNLVLVRIGAYLGNITHCTVIHYLNQYDALKSTKNREFMALLKKI